MQPETTQHGISERGRSFATWTNLIGAMTRVRHCLSKSNSRTRFSDEVVLLNHTLPITGMDGEGAGEMFRVSTLDMANLPRTETGDIDFSRDFFGKESFLTALIAKRETYCMALSGWLIPLDPLSERKIPTPVDIWRNSGWWNPYCFC